MLLLHFRTARDRTYSPHQNFDAADTVLVFRAAVTCDLRYFGSGTNAVTGAGWGFYFFLFFLSKTEQCHDKYLLKFDLLYKQVLDCVEEVADDDNAYGTDRNEDAQQLWLHSFTEHDNGW